MKTLRRIHVIILLLLSSLTGFAQDWQLVWQDEFQSTIGPDWVYDLGDAEGWWNAELQYYKRENASVQNGKLVITAKKEAAGNSQYTSARMKTLGKRAWKYGKIEASMSLPVGRGLWPAFWMMGINSEQSIGEWPKCGEFDIMEHINTEPTIYAAAHWENASGNHQETGGQVDISNVSGYHTYSIEWTPETVKWFVDGNEYYSTSITAAHQSEFHKEFYILFNLAVGGEWPGHDIDESKLPAKMYVEYVRVYQKPSCTVPAQPAAIAGNTTVAPGSTQTYSVAAVTGATSYTWTLPSGWSGTSSTNAISAMAGTSGGTISVKANNTCGAGAARSLTVTTQGATDKLVSAFPNPATDKITVQIGTYWMGGRIAVVNSTGKQIFTERVKGTAHTFDFSGLPTGAYVINVTLGTSKVSHQVYKK
jgi:beta-glucanase (GH16 family)